MLDMGFQEDMENILGQVPPGRQTLLFSATLPSWVHKVRCGAGPRAARGRGRGFGGREGDVPLRRRRCLLLIVAPAVSPSLASALQTAKRFQKDPLLMDLVGEENTGKLADTISLMTMTVRACAAAGRAPGAPQGPGSGAAGPAPGAPQGPGGGARRRAP